MTPRKTGYGCLVLAIRMDFRRRRSAWSTDFLVVRGRQSISAHARLLSIFIFVFFVVVVAFAIFTVSTGGNRRCVRG